MRVVVSDVVCAEWSVFRHFYDWIAHMRRCFVTHCSCMMRGAVVAISSLLRGGWLMASCVQQRGCATSAARISGNVSVYVYRAYREYRSAFWRVAPPVHHVCPLLCV